MAYIIPNAKRQKQSLYSLSDKDVIKQNNTGLDDVIIKDFII